MKNAPESARRSGADSHAEKPHTDTSHSQKSQVQPADDDLDFVVTEAMDQGLEPVGGFQEEASDDDLGLESAAELMEREALRQATGSDLETSRITIQPIGECEPSLPAPSQPNQLELSKPVDSLGKLSADQIRQINEDMHRTEEPSDFLSAEEKVDLIKDLENAGVTRPRSKNMADDQAFSNAPIIPPGKSSSTPPPIPAQSQPQAITSATVPKPDAEARKPKMANRTKGIAYFTKNFIQITGEQVLHDMDEVIVNGRGYVLKKKQISNKFLVGALAPLLAALLFVVVINFSSDANYGSGTIVGLVLTEDNQPAIRDAVIRFAESGQEYFPNAQGFFKTAQIESGSHKIEYLLGGMVVSTDYATVVEGQITTLTMAPTEAPTRSGPPRRPVKNLEYISSVPVTEQTTPAQIDEPASSTPVRKSPEPTRSTPNWAKITLAANVDDAKLTLDNSVVGAGNLTFTRIKPGRHNYTVSKEGYQSASGTINLAAGGDGRLDIELESLEPETPAVSPEQELYTTGMEALKRGDFQSAADDLDRLVALDPANARAHLSLGEAHEGLADDRSAYNEYLQAAEILKISRGLGSAASTYARAIELDPRRGDAYIGRGNLYLERNEAIAAIADFDMAVRLDKRSLPGYVGLGHARFSLSNYKKAVKHFKDARSLAPEDPMIHRMLMLSYFKDGNNKQARKSYEKFLQFASESEVQRMQNDSKLTRLLKTINN